MPGPRPATDDELRDLGRKHAGPGTSVPIMDAAGAFVGSGFYEFARELERRSIAVGIGIKWEDGVSNDQVKPVARPEPATPPSAVLALVRWLIGR